MKAQIGKVYRFYCTGQGEASDCVEWAGDALVEGLDTPSLRILAGLIAPLNPFEVKEYVDASLKELGIDIPSEQEAISAYAKDIASDIIKNPKTIRMNLKKLFKLCADHDYQTDLYDFYLLYCAWDDFDYGDAQHYWDGATKDNIEGIVIKKCLNFINAK